jgi:hypothetical protein
VQIARLYSVKILTEAEVRTLCLKAKELFIEESNIVRLKAPITICGDIHG